MKNQMWTVVARRHFTRTLSVMTMLVSVHLTVPPQPARAQEGVVDSNKNPLQVALSHWYTANGDVKLLV